MGRPKKVSSPEVVDASVGVVPEVVYGNQGFTFDPNADKAYAIQEMAIKFVVAMLAAPREGKYYDELPEQALDVAARLYDGSFQR